MRRTNDLGRDPVGSWVLRLAISDAGPAGQRALQHRGPDVYRKYPDIGGLALAGVGVCGPIVTLLSSVCQSGRTGRQPHHGHAHGREAGRRARRILNNCFLMLLVLSLVLTVSFQLAKDHLLMWFWPVRSPSPMPTPI